jgi:CheY-like chemotaxis protein
MSEREAKSVLLVDDDPEMLWSVGRFLSRAGFDVTTCGDGAEAIPMLEVSTYQVLITDVHMPRLNGLALIEWVHKYRARMRVVVITAFGSPTLRKLCLNSGTLLYLEKPLDPDQLVAVITRAESSEGFSGTVRIELQDYVQVLGMTQGTALVEITSCSDERGRMYFKNGKILHASCGGMTGEEAVLRCLAFQGGSFSSLPWAEPEELSVTKPLDYLLLEAARMADESGQDPSS